MPLPPQQAQENQVFALVLGRVIATLRDHNGWTQADLAIRVGISQPVISRIESGKVLPDIYQYGVLAAAFGLQTADLDARVRDAMERTKLAAQAATQKRAASTASPWEGALAVAGVAGLIGLIGFAVAALFGDQKPQPQPGPKPTPKTPR